MVSIQTQRLLTVREKNRVRVTPEQIKSALAILRQIEPLAAYATSMEDTIEYLRWHLNEEEI